MATIKKIIRTYTERMQGDESSLIEKLGIENGIKGGGGRSKAIAHAINQWNIDIDRDAQKADDVQKLTGYVEEFVRGAYKGATDEKSSGQAMIHLKESSIPQLDVIGDHLAQFQQDIPMLLTTLKTRVRNRAGGYNHTLIITLALARAARGAI